jgi:hypothetical protein
MSFSKNGEWEGKTGPVWGLVPVEGEDIRKRCRRIKVWKYCALLYENGKVRPVETIPGRGEGRIKENDGRGEFNYEYCMKFGKCHNVPKVQQQ